MPALDLRVRVADLETQLKEAHDVINAMRGSFDSAPGIIWKWKTRANRFQEALKKIHDVAYETLSKEIPNA